MVEILRRLRINTRVLLLAVVGLAVAALLVLTAVGGFRTQLEAGQRSQAAMQLTGEVMEAKFRTADMAGWQTGYAFDFARRGRARCRTPRVSASSSSPRRQPCAPSTRPSARGR
ncbi:hypothetical protein [Actinoplanes sp. URMC 104]|uniref:hypothetical protein n=1 Tax=Actinoplanes sp. URMC 104 TaxID=3423409 RepID=UPI003F1A0227